MSIRLVGGDFRTGRASYDDIGFQLVTMEDEPEPVPFGLISAIRPLGAEKRSRATDRILTAAGGSILGGVAAGALAGGLTGPAGAAIGAVAGAMIAVRRRYITSRVELRDGRMFVATAQRDVWDAIQASIDRAPIVEPVLRGATVPVPAPTSILRRLSRRIRP